MTGASTENRPPGEYVSCAHCAAIEQKFDAKSARQKLERLRHRGPDPTTRMLIADVRQAMSDSGEASADLLDIGGGVGTIHHELLDEGVRRAVQVEASAAFLTAAREETERRGHTAQVRFVHGDLVTVADELAPVDVVTLDRVICCYPDVHRLVSLSAAKTRHLYGAVYPRQGWWVRLAVAGFNLLFRLQRSSFRTYLHAPTVIEALLRAAGLERLSRRRTLAWEVVVYGRPGSPASTA